MNGLTAEPNRNRAQIGLRLLGRPAILVNGVEARGLPRKAEALFFLLAVSNRSWSRSDIAELLWDDRGGSGRQSLRVALTKIPEPINAILLRSPDQLALAETDSDLAGWRARCASVRPLLGAGDLDSLDARLADLAAWPGTLLDGLEVDAPAFDDWCYAERQRIQREWQTAVVDAVTHLAGAGRWQGAERALGRLLEIDAAHETAHRWLIQCYMETGRPEAARSQYDLCKRTLATQLGVQPDPSLQVLLHSTGKTPSAPAAESQPSRHASPRTGNLPRQVNSFVGRQGAMNEVRSLFQGHRLVTLVGAGGIGKTRLAVQAGASLVDQYPDGVWFVDLTSISDAQQVPQLLAFVLGVVEQPGRPVIEAIESFIRDRRLLVILDNCEHLIDAAAELARRLLQAGDHVHVLATSREWLHIAGEIAYDLPALTVPDDADRLPVETLAEADAVQLFVDRARAARHDFHLNADNAAAVIDICRRLDGIPLALELAAARVRTLPVAGIATLLKGSFALPGAGGRDRQARQQTLEALIDWSYQLLDANEATLFRRLAVFASGWTLESAQGVVADATISSLDVLRLLGRLVEKSLVVLDMDTARYRLLESIRDFGRSRLTESGRTSDEETDLMRRHVDYFLALAEEARPALAGPDQGAWLQKLDNERENMLAAFARSARFDDSADLGARLLHALRPYWLKRGMLALAAARAEEALARPGMATRNKRRFDVLFSAGAVFNRDGRWREALERLSECLEIARELHNPMLEAVTLQQLGHAHWELGDLASARRVLELGVAKAEEIGQPLEQASAYNVLAHFLRFEGENTSAAALYDKGLRIARHQNEREYTATFLLNLAMVAILEGDTEAACASLRETAAIAEETLSRPIAQSLLDVCAGLAAHTGNASQSARFFGAAEAMGQLTGQRRDAADEAFLTPLVARSKSELGDGFPATEATGRNLDFRSALEEARCWLAELESSA
jgi:predicted ATPase/DNA-binding SARP family transcriptional activator